VWTYDLYRPYLRNSAPDAHYVLMGRWCTLIGLVISIGTAYVAMGFASIMDYVQALFSFFIAPLFGTVLLGMLWKRATRAGGFYGLLAGVGSSVAMFFAVKINPAFLATIALSDQAKPLAEDMYRALWSGLTGIVVTVGVSLVTTPKTDAELEGLVYGATHIPREESAGLLGRPVFWAAVSLGALLILQWIFW